MTRNHQQFAGFVLGVLSISICSANAQFWAITSAPQEYWSSLAISADATRVVAALLLTKPGGIFTPGGSIYVSKDSGATWQVTSAPVTNWACVASSADGTKLVSGVGQFNSSDGYGQPGSGLIYTSTNSGDSWSPTAAPNMSWAQVASSADGTKLAAAATGDAIFTSTNSGATWMASASPTDSWSSVACSVDGSFLVAASRGFYSGSI